MKHFVLFIAFFAFCTLVNAQYINNNGFETWGTTTGADPTGWSSPNSIIAGFMSPPVVTKETTDFYSGLNSAKFETKSVFGYAVPGILTNGTISVNMTSTPPIAVNGGTPFTQRPASFKGYYKYTPSGSDNCLLAAVLLKRNTTTSALDTIAYAQFTNVATVSAWTQFQADFTYNLPDNPDTLQIILISSNPNAAVVGSILKVDELFLEGGTLGLNKHYLQKDVNIFPNPANDIVNIQFSYESKSETSVSMFSLVGQKVKEFTLPKGTELSSLNIRDLKKGMYFIQIQSGKDKFTQKISVE
ncbi:MAG: PCMD domain-containing protein [Bacteroidia bacterium]|nr:PCMD domain-containing protein [Bacteroidia bacterium]